MTLLTDIQFSQGSLQDFHDCRRRFYYRYLRQLAWPALEAEPALENERHLRAGADFHRLVHQSLIGISTETLDTIASNEPLAGWWANFKAHNPIPSGQRLLPEVMLTADLNGVRLVARYDLLALDAEGHATIYDWKTSRRPKRETLAARLQSKVYPLVLALAGHPFNDGQPLAPENIRMQYWFVGEPQTPEVFEYNVDAFVSDRSEIQSLITQIHSSNDTDDFPLTPDEHACRFCVYRSLCNRGTTAGEWQEHNSEGSDLAARFDFDQIDEIQF